MTIPNFPLPHIQPTGTIQNPGDLGALGQSMQGLAPILMALQQLQLEKQRNQTQDKYVTGQLDHMKAQRDAEAQQAAALQAQNQRFGELLPMLGQSMTQMGGGQNAGSFGNPMIVPDFAQREFTTTDALLALPTQDRAEFSKLEPVKEKRKAEQEKEKERQARQAQRAFLQRLNKRDPDMAQRLSMVLDEGVASLPADVRTNVYKWASGADPEALKLASDLVSSGSLTWGEAEQMVQGAGFKKFVLPEGFDRNKKREPLTNPYALIEYRNEIQRDFGMPSNEESNALGRARLMIPAIENMEKHPAPPRAIVQLIASKYGNFGEFVKQGSFPTKYKPWWQAFQQFADPVLRSRTGAAYGAAEPMAIIEQFAEMAGETTGNAQRAAARREISRAELGEGYRAALDQIRRGMLDPGALDKYKLFLETPYVPKKGYDGVDGIPKPPGTP